MIEIIDIKLYHLHLFNVNNLLFTSYSYAVFRQMALLVASLFGAKPSYISCDLALKIVGAPEKATDLNRFE